MMTRKLKVYLAGASAEIERIELLMVALRDDPNVCITYDWVKHVRAQLGSDAEQSRQQRLLAAHLDRRGVREAEIFWFAMPAQGVKSEGGSWELGYAQAMADTLAALQSFNDITGLGLIPGDERIIVVSTPDGAYVRGTLFTELAIERYSINRDADTLRWVLSEAEIVAERAARG